MQDAPSEYLDGWFASEQSELRKIACALKRLDHSATLNVTALVNETYLRLRASGSQVESETHLRQRTARVMRNILADAARARAAMKRGGGIQLVEWDEHSAPVAKNDRELLALDAALTELAALDQHQAELVEWHFFGGLSWAEIASCRGLSLRTVEREWRLIRAWLADRMRPNQ